MTKEEKIKEAWGEYYKINKELIDCNGWLRCCSKTDINTLNFIEENKDNFDDLVCNTPDAFLVFHRPKSLQDIENNNGWIKIESEEDLPKEVIECRTCFYNGKNYIEGVIKKRSPQELSRLKYINEITHYQPIEKTKPPIY